MSGAWPVERPAAIVARNLTLAHRDAAGLAPRHPELGRDALRVLTATAGADRLSPMRDVPSSMLAAGSSPGLFALLALGAGVPLFPGRWSEAFLWHLDRLVAPGGRILLPARERPDHVGLDATGLEVALGRAADELTPGLATFRGSHAIPDEGPASVLTEIVGDLPGIVHAVLLAASGRGVGRLVASELFADDCPDGSAASPVEATGLPDAIREVGRATLLAWTMTAATRVARERFGPRPDGTLLAAGPWAALTAAEAILDPGLGADRAIAIDAGASGIAAGVHIGRALRPASRTRLRLATEPSSVPAACAVACLHAARAAEPESLADAVFDDAWDRLLPGGHLLLHVPSGGATAAADVAVRRIAGRGRRAVLVAGTLREMDPARAGDRATVRVVVKPG